jgi:hypothetical protein
MLAVLRVFVLNLTLVLGMLTAVYAQQPGVVSGATSNIRLVSGGTSGNAQTVSTLQQNLGPFRLMTNPNQGSYIFQVGVSPGSLLKLLVLDEARRTVVQEQLNVATDVLNVAVGVFNAAPGRYFVQLVTSTGTYVKNWTVQAP